MVLFVSKVYPFIRTAPQVGERTDPAAPKTEEGLPELELSDGWYRIRTTIDETLARALNKGRIKVGVKLAITGARVSSVIYLPLFSFSDVATDLLSSPPFSTKFSAQ